MASPVLRPQTEETTSRIAAVTLPPRRRRRGSSAPRKARRRGRRCSGRLRPETVVRRRVWVAAAGAWSPWESVAVGAAGAEVALRRGGLVTVHRDFVGAESRRDIGDALERCGLFRQYKFGNVPEPRVHMLLAPPAAGDGNLAYQYHGVTMRARPIAEVPSVAQLADRCSAAFGGTPWNVGVDVVCYRDGRDSCGWHADDTQGETLVLPSSSSPSGGGVQLRPKQPPHRAPGGAPKRKKVRRSYAHVGEAPLADGDEELELWVGAGDAYSMDRGVQVGYEHAVPKVPPKDTGVRKRVVAILREGDRKAAGAEAFDDADTGLANASLEPPDRWDFDKLGAASATSTASARASGQTATARPRWTVPRSTRARLVETGGHNQAQRGVSGSLVRGAESVVVSRQSSRLREADGVSWLRYTSNLGGAWAPTKPPEAKEAAVYRYDGLYDVVAMWTDGGAPTRDAPRAPKGGGDAYKGAKADVPPSPMALRSPEPAPAAPLDALQRLPPPQYVSFPPPPLAAAAPPPPMPPLPPPWAAARRRRSPSRTGRTSAASRACRRSPRRRAAPPPPAEDAPPPAPPPDALRYERAYTFRLERREAGNACSNAAFLAAATMADAATWLAHRKLYWRHARQRRRRLLELAASAAPMPETKRALEWADALGASSSRILRRLVADATKREDERPVSALLAADDDGAAPKTCALCGAGDDEALGAFLAFADRGAGAGAPKTHVHEACAACSSGVFLDDGGDYCNVLKEVKRGRGMRCAADKACTRRPKLSGATVGCGKKSCKRSYHVPCALATGWCFGPSKTFYCARHRGGVDHDPDDVDEAAAAEESWLFDCACGVTGANFDDGSAMWACTVCDAWQHAACAGGGDAPAEDYACFKCVAKRQAAAPPLDAPAPPEPALPYSSFADASASARFDSLFMKPAKSASDRDPGFAASAFAKYSDAVAKSPWQ
ncbi:SET domain-containing protein [Aureococcus anophagefferens]|nr:SET domain-containing protein [Aureococcus anophagefferens]